MEFSVRPCHVLYVRACKGRHACLFGVRPGTALWPTAGGAIGLDNGIRPADTGSKYHGVGFTTFACVRFRTYRTPSYLAAA